VSVITLNSYVATAERLKTALKNAGLKFDVRDHFLRSMYVLSANTKTYTLVLTADTSTYQPQDCEVRLERGDAFVAVGHALGFSKATAAIDVNNAVVCYDLDLNTYSAGEQIGLRGFYNGKGNLMANQQIILQNYSCMKFQMPIHTDKNITDYGLYPGSGDMSQFVQHHNPFMLFGDNKVTFEANNYGTMPVIAPAENIYINYLQRGFILPGGAQAEVKELLIEALR
jgi:hypothetical protein